MHEHDSNQDSTRPENALLKMRAVTISREYGSGGGEIAHRLATRLGWQLVDHEVVTLLAQRMGVTTEEAEAYDEHVGSFVERLLTGMRAAEPALLLNLPPGTLKPEELYQRALHQVVVAAARERHVVIVGRGSQVVLGPRRDVLHVRIVAPLAVRIRYVMLREGLDYDSARNRIQLKDRDRHRYLQAQYQCDSADPHLYDLVCNTGIINLDDVVALICTALTAKATGLTIPTDQLGPAASATQHYPTSPGDFRPPPEIYNGDRS